MKSFVQTCLAIGFLLIHLETVAVIYKTSGAFMAFMLLSMPIVAELHLAFHSVIDLGLVNPVTVTYGIFVGLLVLSAGWLRD